MTQRVKKIFVSILMFLFFLGGSATVLYSQGYRVDFEKRKIVQTGGLYFKVLPSGSEVYLNGKLVKKVSFLFGSAFIENLLPKKYEVEIKRDGYYSWKKNLEVQEKFVTDAKNVVLFPKNPTFSFFQNAIKNFWLSPDNKKIIYERFNEKGKILEIFDLEKNTRRVLISDLEDFIGEIMTIDWSPDSKQILLKTLTGKEIKFFILRLIDESKPVLLDFLEKDFREVSFYPGQSSKIFFLKKNQLFEADYLEKTKKLILNDIISYFVLNGNLIWLDNRGFILRSDLSGRILEILNLKPIEILPETSEWYEYKILGPNFLKKSDTLFYLDPTSKNFIKISENFKNLKFSPSFKKVALLSENEIWVFFLEDLAEQPQRKAGEKIFLFRFSKKPENLFWLTDHYLIFNVGERIKISEIDDRDRINIIDLAEFQNPKIFWNGFNKKLYILSNQNLYFSQKLIP